MRPFGALASRYLIAALLVAATSGPALALDIDEAHWGFDGLVVEKRFNLVSVLVRNNTPNAFDGELMLRRQSGASSVDIPLGEPVFLAPFSARWVQYAAYCGNANDAWTVSWSRRASDRVPLPPTSAGRPAQVFLAPADDLAARPVGFKRFPDNLFPPSVTMTDGLASVALGHVPRWEASRRRAFLDWIARGGLVHLVPDATGKPPRFTAELSDLNNPAEEFRIGSGRVFRYEADRSQLSAAQFERRERPWRTIALKSPSAAGSQGPSTPGAEPSAAEDLGQPSAKNDGTTESVTVDNVPVGSDADSDPSADTSNFDWMQDNWVTDPGARVLEKIKPLARADHNWFVIYLMAIAYLGTVFPGIYLLGQRKLDPRVVYGALLGVVAVFSLAFGWVGRRGYGESTSVHAATIARRMPSGWDVSAWGNLFVRDGDVYRFALPGSGGAYTTGQDLEAVNGVVRSGGEPVMLLDMPPYSSRTFVARTRVEKLPADFALVDPPVVSPSGRSLSVSISHSLTATAKPQRAIALLGDSIYELSVGANRLESRGATGTKVDDWLRANNESWSSQMLGGPFDTDNTTPEARYSAMMPMLVARAFELVEANDRRRVRLPAGRLRLFVYADLSDGLRSDDPRYLNQFGRTLYVVDLFLPEPKPAAP